MVARIAAIVADCPLERCAAALTDAVMAPILFAVAGAWFSSWSPAVYDALCNRVGADCDVSPEV
jgi:hypothetical protein